jgi:16S rRNA (guanine966-N2)-methyltransferase
VRVTGGVARGRRLKRPPPGARATSDLLRAAIFDALDARSIDRARVLDLYAGSGALGIEALSRGSEWCDFVDRDARSVAVIKENLALCGMEARGRVHRLTVQRAPERLEGPYALVLADPPYEDESAPAALARVVESPLADERTTLVLEHSSRRAPPESLGPLRRVWSRRHGDSSIAIYRREP